MKKISNYFRMNIPITSFLKTGLFLAGIVFVANFFWNIENQTLEEKLVSLGKVGEIVVEDLGQGAGFAKSENGFFVSDSKKGFPTIQVAEAKEDEKEQNLEADPRQKDAGNLEITLPSDYSQPLEVKLDGARKIEITDLGKDKFKTEASAPEKGQDLGNFPQGMTAPEAEFSHYRSSDGRKEIYYAYQTKENSRILKNWILYQKGNGNEEETYHFKSAILRKNEQGEVEVYHFGAADESQGVQVEGVSQDLFARAQLAIGNDMREDIEKNGGTPDFVIPKPYFIDAQGERTDLEWKIDQQKNEISVSFSVKKDRYPLALDPTLEFTAPGQSNSSSVIQGEATNNSLGASFAVGDLNSDGKTDLAVGAHGYSSNTGRVYIFYGGKPFTFQPAVADVIITGEAASRLGISLAAGDFNSDGKTDLAVGAHIYSSNTGRAYIFYNDGSIPATAASADVIITGEASNNFFGFSLAAGDFNSDGKTDLAVGAHGYSSSTGRAYIFHNDGSIATTAATADVIITGEETTNQFGISLLAGDFNFDGTADLVVGADYYASFAGRVYIFHNDGTIPTDAAAADVIITGQGTNNNFGFSLAAGDFNGDGKTDLAVGAYGYSSYTGRAYIFYNDGFIPTTAASADVIITGQGTNNDFGISLAVGDLNSDGRTDLVVAATRYSSYSGRVYIFYSNNGILDNNQDITGIMREILGGVMVAGDFNDDGTTDLAVGYRSYNFDTGRVYIFYSDGSIPTTAATADVIITGETTDNDFGFSLTSGDFNADGKTDLAVGAFGYSTSTGRAYIFYNDGSIPTTAATADVIITGETTDNDFGFSLTSGDFNFDGKTDLAVGARGYSSDTGRAYIFYNDVAIPTTAAAADVIITGEAMDDYFGVNLVSGDFNADGRTDLAVGAWGYSSSTGSAYIFHNDGTIPNTAATADVTITGEATYDYFGSFFAAGDFNADGRIDLAVGASGYATDTGRVYIFYNDGTIPTTAATADVIITGETTSNFFGDSLVAGDFNFDGRTDLAVGADGYSSFTGRVYIFYNDGSIPTTADTADVIITGEGTYNGFSVALSSGDFNSDGRMDLAVGASGYSTAIGGRFYIFYNDGSIPTNAADADVTSTGEGAGSLFGRMLASGDFNGDGKIDLAVGAYNYSNTTGRVYIFYNDGSIPNTAAAADVIITGEATNNYFGRTLVSGDFNSDGKTDLVVEARGYANDTGRVYIFYNDGTIPTMATEADVIITGEATNNYFGASLASGDFNGDGKIDLAVGAYKYLTDTGRTYIFYNDGSIPTTAATADVIITGETTNNGFGFSLASGDFNSDGQTDLAVGAIGYSSNIGRVYIFHNDGSIPATADAADVIITGQTTNNWFGFALASGDLNSDGRTDLVVGSSGYVNATGRVYIFYNDGSIPTTNANADVIITGQATMSYFSSSLATGDFNSDGRTDLAVGAYYYATATGRVHIFYNDGTIPTTAATADVIITGEHTNSFFGNSLVSGDFNADGTVDLAIGAYNYLSGTGRVHFLFTSPGTALDRPVTIQGKANLQGRIEFK